MPSGESLCHLYLVICPACACAARVKQSLMVSVHMSVCPYVCLCPPKNVQIDVTFMQFCKTMRTHDLV